MKFKISSVRHLAPTLTAIVGMGLAPVAGVNTHGTDAELIAAAKSSRPMGSVHR